VTQTDLKAGLKIISSKFQFCEKSENMHSYYPPVNVDSNVAKTKMPFMNNSLYTSQKNKASYLAE
jgi:hypothetical protein